MRILSREERELESQRDEETCKGILNEEESWGRGMKESERK